jgi:hypothetical protein
LTDGKAEIAGRIVVFAVPHGACHFGQNQNGLTFPGAKKTRGTADFFLQKMLNFASIARQLHQREKMVAGASVRGTRNAFEPFRSQRYLHERVSSREGFEVPR